MDEQNYYVRTGRKVADFFVGFAGIILLDVLVIWGVNALRFYAGAFFVLLGVTLAGIAAAVYLMKFSSRRFIGIGILVPCLIVVVFSMIFGACISIFKF